MSFMPLSKLKGELAAPIKYSLPLGENLLDLSSLIGKKISLEFKGNISCTHCGREIKKTFADGYCFPCFRSLAQCDSCIVKPEECHYDEGTCREPEWGEKHCLQPHYVYLANSSALKVGITRAVNIPGRWIDQGASSALPIFKVKSRLISGLVEVCFKNFIADKTNWRKMLKGEVADEDLYYRRDELFELTEGALSQIMDEKGEDSIEYLEKEETTFLEYPVLKYPTKITSLNFDKLSRIEGALQGIKGQYLLLDTGVLNIRKFTGYHIKFSTH